MAYDNSARQERARLTRSRVLAAARDAFLDAGYAATTIKGVAGAAGVSAETVYKTFGSKAGLLKAVYDITLAGDEEPVPIAQRPEFQALRAATDAASTARAYGRYAGWMAFRSGPLLRVMLSNRGGDADLEAFATTIDTERLTGATMAVTGWAERGWLRPGLDPDRARDMLWTYISPAVHLLLTDRGWTREDYEAWLADTLLATLLVDRPVTRSPA